MTSSTRPAPSRACRSCSSEGHRASGLLAQLRRLLGGVALLATLGLAGCATTFRLDSQVNSFSSLTGVPAAGYRFERMPLQQADPQQPRVEALAEAALARAGLRRDDAAPAYGVQAWAVAQRVADPWGGPWYDPWWGPGGWGQLGMASGGRVGVGVGIGIPLGGPYGPYYGRTWVRREAGLVIRELASGQVVYQTQAVSDGPWMDPDRTLGALFDAALQGFPRPPAGPRQVDITLSR